MNAIWLKVTGWVVGMFTDYLVPVLAFFAGKKAQRNDDAREELEDARKDADIANQPAKSRLDLLAWLRGKK